MAAASQTVRVVADLTMHVSRNATGDLEAGAESVVARIDAVESVDGVDVTDLQPRLNDLQVEATVEATLDVDDAPDTEAATREVLADGFGVDSVDDLQLDRAVVPPGEPVQEVG